MTRTEKQAAIKVSLQKRRARMAIVNPRAQAKRLARLARQAARKAAKAL